MLGSPTDHTRCVLVWNELLKWLPDTSVEAEAKSEMVEKEISVEMAELLDMFARVLEKYRQKYTLSSDRSFRKLVYDSMQEIEILLKNKWPTYVATFKPKRRAYLYKLYASRG
ncbi:MAG: hypothetical protein IPG76_00245 [Acidobacteria bacterium]|nr:hypothetical protein [Acidobacteriota bacterium]